MDIILDNAAWQCCRTGKVKKGPRRGVWADSTMFGWVIGGSEGIDVQTVHRSPRVLIARPLTQSPEKPPELEFSTLREPVEFTPQLLCEISTTFASTTATPSATATPILQTSELSDGIPKHQELQQFPDTAVVGSGGAPPPQLDCSSSEPALDLITPQSTVQAICQLVSPRPKRKGVADRASPQPEDVLVLLVSAGCILSWLQSRLVVCWRPPPPPPLKPPITAGRRIHPLRGWKHSRQKSTMPPSHSIRNYALCQEPRTAVHLTQGSVRGSRFEIIPPPAPPPLEVRTPQAGARQN